MEVVEYGNQQIHFHLKKVGRKTLGIEVHPDLSTWAIAPNNVTISEVKTKILKRAKWIIKQKSFFEQFLPRTPERMFVSGETHLYLGKRYILRVRKGLEDSVKLIGGELVVSYRKDKSTDAVKRLLTGWYYEHAQNKFDKVIKEVLSKFNSYKLEHPPIEIRRMKNRWGSCTPKGKIILNPELIKAPGKCIEYVVSHEVCHLVYPNHGKDFYNLQDSVFPTNSKWKDKLEQFLV